MERQQQQQREDYIAPMLRSGPEGMPSFYRFLIVVAVYITALLTLAMLLWLAFCYAFNRALFDSIWAGLVEIGTFVKLLAFVCGGAGALYVVGRVVTSIMARWPRPQIATFEEAENLVVYGAWRTRQFSYLKAPVVERRKVKTRLGTKVEQVPPSIPLQIQAGLLAVGMPDIIHGFDASNLAPVRLPSCSTLTIGGTGSGKTRGNVWRNLQRAIVEEASVTVQGFAYVAICDPHATKGDGIAPLVASAESYVRIARTPQEIVAAAREFYTELEARKAGRSTEKTADGAYRPRHIFFDEWAALMDDKQPAYPYTKEERALFLACMLGSVREYRGYGGYGHISMQNPKESNIGDVTLRDDMPLLLVHKVSEKTCSFLYPSSIEADKRKQVLKLKKRQCFVDYRTDELQYVTIMPEILDDCASHFVRLLQEAGLPTLASASTGGRLLSAARPGTAPAGGLNTDQQAMLAELLQMLRMQTPQTEERMPDLPLRQHQRTTQPLREQIAFPGGDFLTSVEPQTDALSSEEERITEAEVEVASTTSATSRPRGVEPIGRELVLNMIDDVISGKITPHDFLKWANASGGRKYTARRQALQNIQQLNEGE